MIFRKRPIAPPCLTEVKTKQKIKKENHQWWGEAYDSQLKDPLKSNTFQWKTYKKEKVNKILEPELRAMTQNHCAFCDFFPLQQSGGTIEHFYPKAFYPKKSYEWENLFYSCHKCQEKGNNFDTLLLKPDEASYDFKKYFVINYSTFELEPNPKGIHLDQKRAELTIEIYGLNNFGRPENRRRVFNCYFSSGQPEINDFPYRYLFED